MIVVYCTVICVAVYCIYCLLMVAQSSPVTSHSIAQMTFTYERRLATFRQLHWPHSANNSSGKKYKSQPEDVNDDFNTPLNQFILVCAGWVLL